jgi:hypothetical protein
MKKTALLVIFLKLIPLLQAEELVITPTNFLDTQEPVRFCDLYVRQEFGEEARVFTQPSGGALVRVDEGGSDRCLYIFCDEPLHRLILFTLTDTGQERIPISMREYGKQIDDPYWVFEGYGPNDTIDIPITPRDSAECFDRPVDVAVSSCGRYFDSEDDRIFVLDQANHRVTVLRYDYDLDSLCWLQTFGADILRFPTAIDYADYGDQDYGNDDLYITDAGLAKVLRFSAQGVFETSYGGWGRGLASITYPTSVAVSTSVDFPNRIYVTDSHNHRVVRYYSESTGPIMAECQRIFPLNPLPLINGVDTDAEGNVYVVNTFAHEITVLFPTLSEIRLTYGTRGYEPGQFDFPVDIYIDNNEIQICEYWADSAGVQSFRISAGSAKKAVEILPYRFHLRQNYPNPFNSNTTIMFELPTEGHVNLVIYNVLGQRVRTLAEQMLSAGRHSIMWDGKNQAGEPVSSGLYFSVLGQGEQLMSRKLLLLK